MRTRQERQEEQGRQDFTFVWPGLEDGNPICQFVVFSTEKRSESIGWSSK
jgi:hypothetical protein